MKTETTLRLYNVLFKKGLHGTRIVYREYVWATGLVDACNRLRAKAKAIDVIRLTALPVPSDDPARQKQSKALVPFCRKAGR